MKLGGGGGGCNLSATIGHLTVWTTRHRSGRTLVRDCDFVTDMGHRTRLGTRAELGFTGGGPQWLVTELGVFDYPGGQARLAQVFPDVTVAEVRAATGFDLQVAGDLRHGPAAVSVRAGRGPLGRPARGPHVRVLAQGADPDVRAGSRPGLRMLNGRRRAGWPAVFAPRRVALVGASDRAGSVGRLLWDNLAGFPGEVVPVGPAARVGGQLAYPGLRDVPGQVDLAVIATPAATVPGIVRDAAAKGVAAVIVLSAGFAETGGEGAALQAEAVAAARAGGVRLVGPNCFGVQNADLPLNASIAAGTPRGGGGVSIVTQSGSYGMAVHALGQDEGLRVAKVFAAGNKADITDAELLAYLRQDPDTSVICLLLESITDARGFFTEACLTTPRKPVVAIVGGRTSAGARAAMSHTAALATDDAVRDAALRQAGVVRVRTGLQVLDAARALSSQPVPRGPRVAVVTNSGGTGVELTDLLADEGLVVPELSESLQKELRGIMPGYASARNPVDMTPAWKLFSTVYPGAIEMLARSGEIDVVVPVLLQRSASAEVAEAVRDAVGTAAGRPGAGAGLRVLGRAAVRG